MGRWRQQQLAAWHMEEVPSEETGSIFDGIITAAEVDTANGSSRITSSESWSGKRGWFGQIPQILRD
jgi:hypothetical protein